MFLNTDPKSARPNGVVEAGAPAVSHGTGCTKLVAPLQTISDRE